MEYKKNYCFPYTGDFNMTSGCINLINNYNYNNKSNNFLNINAQPFVPLVRNINNNQINYNPNNTNNLRYNLDIKNFIPKSMRINYFNNTFNNNK